MSNFLADTIIAIATAPGEGGIGIVRLSGPSSAHLFSKFWSGKTPIPQFESHKLYFGVLLDPQSQEKLDEILAVWMKSPHSYTGEEVIEIHAHGGPYLLNKILHHFLESGARLAQPGEFTRRAYLNGKMDLLQAEAVAEIIHAKSEGALRNAQAQLTGRLSDQIRPMREKVIFLMARVEAAIDFPEEDIPLIQIQQTLEEIHSLQKTLTEWLAQFKIGRLLREGIKIALVGSPNVGKSSLLNRLLGEERAIVHDQPGTTRDVVEAFLDWEGIALQIFDTAGIRESQEYVEQQGIKKTKQILESADLTLVLLDLSKDEDAGDSEVFSLLQEPYLLVGNKSDLLKDGAVLRFEKVSNSKALLKISAKTGDGIPELQKAILAAIGMNQLEDLSHAYLNHARHRQALEKTLEALARAEASLVQKLPSECTAADLRFAAESLGVLIGAVKSDDVLDKIFSEFCLGK